MSGNVARYGLWAVKILLGLAFLASSMAKFLSVEMLVYEFGLIGLGQWFRYVTGIVELAGAILIFVPRLQAIGGLVLGGTMVGALIAHVTVLGPPFWPAVLLGALALLVVIAHRRDIPLIGRRLP